MDLLQIIALLLPASLAVTIHENKIAKRKINLLFLFLNYVCIINLLNFIIVYFLFNYNELAFTVSFTLKYLLLSIINVLITTSLVIFYNQNITIDFKQLKDNKSNEKKKK